MTYELVMYKGLIKTQFVFKWWGVLAFALGEPLYCRFCEEPPTKATIIVVIYNIHRTLSVHTKSQRCPFQGNVLRMTRTLDVKRNNRTYPNT